MTFYQLAFSSSILIFVLLNMFFCGAICGDAEHGNHYNSPNANLAGLSKHGQKIENHLHDQVAKEELSRNQVGTFRVLMLRHQMAIAQGARNDAKRDELQVRKELHKKGCLSNLVRSCLPKKLRPDSLEDKLKYRVDRKEKQKEKIRNIVSDAAIHKAHGNFNDEDVTKVVKYPWRDSHSLGYDHDARITSAPGYKSRSPSPIHRSSQSPTSSRSQPASPNRSS